MHKEETGGRRFRRRLGQYKIVEKCSRRLIKEEEVKINRREQFIQMLHLTRIKQAN